MKNATEIIIVLDKSGSMGPRAADAIGGFNQFIADQQKESRAVQQWNDLQYGPCVEPPESELGGNDHQRVEQEERGQVNGSNGAFRGHDTEGHHPDRSEKGNADPVDDEPRNFAQGNARIG